MHPFALLLVFSSAPAVDAPLPQLPYTPGLNAASMDRSVDPCVDFYAYSCGGWRKANPIPPDQSRWSVYGKLDDEVQRHLWGLLLDAAKPGPTKTALEKKVGDYFAACMDEAAVEAKGAAPLKNALDALARVTDRNSLAAWLAEQHLATESDGLLFDFGSQQDASDATQFIAAADAGGLGLPDRDDYLARDQKSVALRARYHEHIERLLTLLGDDAKTAKSTADDLLRLETELAKASLTRVERRDPYKIFHRMDRAAVKKAAPTFDWDTYLSGMQLKDTRVLNLSEPKFFARISALLAKEPLDLWKRYLRFHLVDASASDLSRAFVAEDFDFHQKYLRGAEQIAPRWKRCVRSADRDLSEALGELFVKKNFAPELKQRTKDMVVAIKKEMKADLETLPWMSPKTKEEALTKLNGMADKIGYPDKWRDYSSVVVARDDFFGNVGRALRFEHLRVLGRIGQPLDRGEWSSPPQTVNAYYDPQMNDINFMAAVLQPPLYDPKMDAAPNYGNTGGTVGHELTHGFDDEGRQFDAKGNLRDWWTKKDSGEFKRRAKCISDQYSKYIAVDDVHVNGELTLGEDVADLGGLILAYRAWKTDTASQKLEPKEGLTPDQRFFVGYAQWACSNTRPEAARLRARTDPHSPAEYRVNGLVVNMPEFAAAFACPAGRPMVKPAKEVCKVW